MIMMIAPLAQSNDVGENVLGGLETRAKPNDSGIKLYDGEMADEIYSPGKAGFLKRFFTGKRVRAAGEFALEVVITNIHSVSQVSSDYEPRFFDKIIAPVAETIKYPLCLMTGVSGFLYSFCAFRYSDEKGGYGF